MLAVCIAGLSSVTAAPAIADENVPLNSGECKFGTDNIAETPWSLQRLLTNQLWANGMKGQGIRVGVIDTGIDDGNQQLKSAIGSGGKTFVHGKPTEDKVGHGTKVAGIIAARPVKGSGFFGIAPKATVIPFQQTSDEKAGTADSLARAVDKAVAEDVDIINISQGTGADPRLLPTLEQSIARANTKGILVVASAGNGGADGGEKNMYPAAYSNKYPNVLAVAASDRNNERAPFSQSGPFVQIAAPGVDMVSTVPDGGNCVDQGTSFSAPYVTGAAALLKAKHKDWSPQQLIWHLEQTAERVGRGRDNFIGWGVVDPVAALNDDTEPTAEPKPDKPANVADGSDIHPVAVTLGESPEDRRARVSVYIVGGGLLAVGTVVGCAIALRDWRRKTS
ncbi:type VII secretion-associated serine protease mycosin [Streptomyces sp. 2224.1]|nr:type VII secretion-associated serine protease mycosin [Streptomyces sp. 2321.6]SDR15998.1 type VII secretion-associated serine protease mycosin [Streptomyces sp. KS_16]SEB48566.1 type VII secretion-associated serine protease mycosin [Streptomyces sp. 2224.1]SED66673.1 type VII secretion-associated serine protease mycosin [Streptomyces sp. 2133.1]SEE16334.1 type VII secretion-associated serine protease mycosin [Streptomyces sp. 2112.3]SNC71631.1 type VII secretion-associated serine protease 